MIQNIQLVPGHIRITEDNGNKKDIKITDMLRAADIPNMRIASLTLLTELAQVVAVIVKTLQIQGILGENLTDGFDMDYVDESLETDLAVELPNADN